MLDVFFTNQFKRDYKAMKRRGAKRALLEEVVNLLRTRTPLPEKYRDHALMGEYTGSRECHIQPDWLLIYQVEEDRLILVLSRTGSHCDLF